EVSGLAQSRLEQLGDRRRVRARAEVLHRLVEAGDRSDRRGAHPWHLLDRTRDLPDRAAGGVRVGREPPLARIADPAPGRVDDPPEGHLVRRVDEQAQIRHRVLDLGPLVELRPADHLVGELEADQGVLEHPAHRVRPVEDRDVLAADPLLHAEALDLACDPARLLVLVGELGELDRLTALEVGPEALRPALAVWAADRVGGRRGWLGWARAV